MVSPQTGARSCPAQQAIHCPPAAHSLRDVFAVAHISFSFPEFVYYFLTIWKAPEGKWVGFLQVIPGNSVNLQSQLLTSYWVEMSK